MAANAALESTASMQLTSGPGLGRRGPPDNGPRSEVCRQLERHWSGGVTSTAPCCKSRCTTRGLSKQLFVK